MREQRPSTIPITNAVKPEEHCDQQIDGRSLRAGTKRSPAVRLELLRRQRAALEARIQSAESSAKASARRDEARLKFIVGGAMLADARIQQDTQAVIKSVLSRTVIVPRDREFLVRMGMLSE